MHDRQASRQTVEKMRQCGNAWLKKIDDWRRQQPDLPNISEAIRRLVDAGLEATSKKAGRK
jgi:hypothetical protein